MNILTDGSRVHLSADYNEGSSQFTGNLVTVLVKSFMCSNCILDILQL